MLKFILLIFASSVAITLSLDYEIQPAVVATCEVFNRSGLTCRDCNTLAACVLMNGVWQSYDVDRCDDSSGFYCNSFEQQCSNSTGPCNRLIDFACSEEGYFPNPYTCQEYYSCVRVSQATAIVPFVQYCAIGTGYSVATRACTLTIADAACLSLQWQCNYPGDMGLWPGTDDIFFLCLRNPATDELIPELHKCINDQIFNGNDCVARNGGSPTPSPETTTATSSPETTTTSSSEITATSTTEIITETMTPETTTTSTSVTTTSAETTTEITTTTLADFVCIAPGLFPNPNDCRQYFVCDSSLSAILHDCPNGTYFVPGTNACAWGTC